MTARQVLDAQVYVPLLVGCAKVVALAIGVQVHSQIKKSGIQLDTPLGNALINMYGKCGKLDDAFCVFNEMKTLGVQRDTITWSTMIQAFGIHKQANKALSLLQDMLTEAAPNGITFLALLQQPFRIS
jgi:pentatricopeptide repeat protein